MRNTLVRCSTVGLFIRTCIVATFGPFTQKPKVLRWGTGRANSLDRDIDFDSPIFGARVHARQKQNGTKKQRQCLLFVAEDSIRVLAWEKKGTRWRRPIYAKKKIVASVSSTSNNLLLILLSPSSLSSQIIDLDVAVPRRPSRETLMPPCQSQTTGDRGPCNPETRAK